METNLAMHVLDAYQRFQETHSHIANMLAAEFMFVSGDLISQKVLNKKINPRKLVYTATLAPFYGLCLEGLMETGNLVGKYISNNPILKAALGPNLWGNAFNTFFFSNNTLGEKTNYSIPELLKNYARIFSPSEIRKNKFWGNVRDKYWNNISFSEYKKTVIATLTGWNIFQAFNYYAIPESLRTSTTLIVGTIWTSVMTAWSSKGASNINKRVIENAPTTPVS
ncbi:hypothetical protein C4573_06560 [Candidatus Woesearchaeota archaeon]|nr:MAG: hypothetical protein C4573_06560 [Candidatus Woesearchaeota archaeon]